MFPNDIFKTLDDIKVFYFSFLVLRYKTRQENFEALAGASAFRKIRKFLCFRYFGEICPKHLPPKNKYRE